MIYYTAILFALILIAVGNGFIKNSEDKFYGVFILVIVIPLFGRIFLWW